MIIFSRLLFFINTYFWMLVISSYSMSSNRRYQCLYETVRLNKFRMLFIISRYQTVYQYEVNCVFGFTYSLAALLLVDWCENIANADRSANTYILYDNNEANTKNTNWSSCVWRVILCLLTTNSNRYEQLNIACASL